MEREDFSTLSLLVPRLLQMAATVTWNHDEGLKPFQLIPLGDFEVHPFTVFPESFHVEGLPEALSTLSTASLSPATDEDSSTSGTVVPDVQEDAIVSEESDLDPVDVEDWSGHRPRRVVNGSETCELYSGCTLPPQKIAGTASTTRRLLWRCR